MKDFEGLLNANNPLFLFHRISMTDATWGLDVQAGLQMLSALLKAQPGNGDSDILKTLQAKVASAQTAQVQLQLTA